MGIKFVILEGLCYLLKKCKGNVRFGFIYIYMIFRFKILSCDVI